MSKLPAFTKLKAGMAPAALVVAIGGLSLLLSACGGGEAKSTATASPTVSATAVVTPEVSAAPNRQDCVAILGTPYLSPEEGEWYKANCARFDGPAVAPAGNSQVLIGDTLIIPGISVNTPVSRSTVPESGAMPDPVGYFNAVWYDFSRFESFGGYANAGNLILSGHVDCARCINGSSGRAVFWGIRNLKTGDTAQYQLADGTMNNYVVVSSEALSVNSDWEKIVASSTADMTLITCTGTFSGGEYNQRHVVALKKV